MDESTVTMSRMRAIAAISIVLTSLLATGACSTASTAPATSTSEPGAPAAAMPSQTVMAQPSEGGDTLYAALGGEKGVELLADNFVIELAADERVRPHYEKSDIGRFHRMMQLQICELSGGPCKYTGDNMKRTHGGMNIKSNEFNAVVEALMRAMDNIALNPGTQNRLLAIFAPMRADIVGQ